MRGDLHDQEAHRQFNKADVLTRPTPTTVSLARPPIAMSPIRERPNAY